jgi:hypothetical protein
VFPTRYGHKANNRRKSGGWLLENLYTNQGCTRVQLSQLQGRKRVTSGLPFTQGQRDWETREG